VLEESATVPYCSEITRDSAVETLRRALAPGGGTIPRILPAA
jgi:hypothetical protein